MTTVTKKSNAKLSANFEPMRAKWNTSFFSIERKLRFWKKCGYIPTPAQLEAHKDNTRFFALVAAGRFGKTLWVAAEMAYALMCPDFRIWIVGPTYHLARKEFDWLLDLLTAYRLPNGKSLITLARVSNPQEGRCSIRFPDIGSSVETLSTDDASGIGLLGSSLDMIVLAEGANIKLGLWTRYLSVRLGDRLGRALIPSTPAGDSGLLKEFYDNGIDPELPEWGVRKYTLYENIHFSREEIERQRAILPPDEFAEQYLGEFRSRRGLVFEFDSEVHVFSDYTVEIHSLPCVMGVRYKDNNPVSGVLIKVDYERQIYYVVDEYFVESSVPYLCDWIRAKQQKHTIRAIVTEHRDKGVMGEIKQQGISITSNKQEDNFSARQSYLKRLRLLQELLEIDPIGGSRLYVYSQCENTIKQFSQCAWPRKREIGEQNDMPSEENMYLPRCCGYALAKSESILGKPIYK